MRCPRCLVQLILKDRILRCPRCKRPWGKVMKKLILPEDHGERCDFLNENKVRPIHGQLFCGEVEVELVGYELCLDTHPADNALNSWQLFKVGDTTGDPAGLWEVDDTWI